MDNLLEEGLEIEFTHFDEQGKVEAISYATNKLDNGEEFSFYELILNEKEQYVLNNISIQDFANKVNYLSIQKNLYGYFVKILEDILIEESYEASSLSLSKLMVRMVSNILSATGHDDAEVILRAEKLSDDNYCNKNANCAYWHIDKSHGQIREEQQEVPFPIGNALQQKTYIISLLGATTIYYNPSVEQKLRFEKLANSTTFTYGHDHRFDCKHDEINKLLLPHLALRADRGQGSVHTVGANGAIHAVPIDNCEDRLLLLITPI